MINHAIYLLRHGQTYFNLEDRVGGDSELTPKGFEHAEKVSRWLDGTNLMSIYCSTLRRSIQTAEVLRKYHPESDLIQIPELCEISGGDLDSITYAEFEHKFPELFAARKKDKYNWAYPNGENYAMVRERVKPILDELESKEGAYAIVGHQAMNRTILGHMMDLPKAEIPFLVTPNDVIFVLDLQKSEVSHVKDGKQIKGYLLDTSSTKTDISKMVEIIIPKQTRF